MRTSLHKDILEISKRLLEQGLPPLPPVPGGDTGGGAGAPAGQPAGNSKKDSDSEDEEMVDSGQPPVDQSDPVRAVYDYGMAIAKETIDPQVIENAFKSAIQANFGADISEAWPLIERLRNTQNVILMDVANRLALFISGTIQENKRMHMKISREEIRKTVREALGTKKPTKLKEINLTEKQLKIVIQNTVKRVINEGALFDTYRSQIDQEQSAIEQQLTSADIRRMAIDLFEKICDKTGVDSDSLTPEAMQFVKAELDRMVTSAQEIANKLVQVATVVKTAQSSNPKSEEGEE